MVDTKDDLGADQAMEQSSDDDVSILPAAGDILQEIDQICEKCQAIDLSKADPQRPEETLVAVNLTKFQQFQFNSCHTCRFFVKYLPKLIEFSLDYGHKDRLLYLIPFRSRDLIWHPDAVTSKSTLVKTTTSFVIDLSNRINRQRAPGRALWNDFLTPSILNKGSHQSFRHANLGETVDFDQVRSYLDFCHTHHDECKIHVCRESNKPIRVIDCHNRSVVWLENWGVVSCEAYVTLSYVWGSTRKQKFKPGPLLEKVSLPIQIPALIEDSIMATLRLGYSYLWVDYYCIDQSNKNEVEIQVGQMDAIYSNSVATLIAPMAKDPDEHIPGVSKKRREGKNNLVKIGKEIFAFGNIQSHEGILTSPWGGRAWTYQEAVLSSRRVVFGQEDVWVQCHRMVFSERIEVQSEHLSQAQPRIPDLPCYFYGVSHESDKDVKQLVWSHIMQYSERHLSYHTDGLRAFFGILRAIKEAYPDLHHISGLPITCPGNEIKNITDQFSHALTWFRGDFSGEEDRRISDFPSWSWLGWKLNTRISAPTFSTHLGQPIYRRYPFGVLIDINSLPTAFNRISILNGHFGNHESNDRQSLSGYCPPNTLILGTIPFIEITALTIDLELTGVAPRDMDVQIALHDTNISAFSALDTRVPESNLIRGTAILIYYSNEKNDESILGDSFDTAPRPGDTLHMLLVTQGSDILERIGLIMLSDYEDITLVLSIALKQRRKILLQ